MAAHRNVGISDAPFVAGVDFSASGQYQAVSPGSVSGEVILAVGPSGNPWPLGVLQNSPCSSQEATVRCFGFTKMKVRANASSLRWGAWLFCASDGVAEPFATEANGTVALPLSSSMIFARYMDSGTVSSGSAIGQVLLFPLPISTCGILGAS